MVASTLSHSGLITSRIAATFRRLGAALLLGSLLQAGTTGKITGRVVDQATGEPLIGVNVIVKNTDLGAATNVEGYYLIVNVPPGFYDLQFSMIGYQELVITRVEVRSDHTTTIDANLTQTVLAVKEAVMVIATRPVIEMDRTSTEASVTSEQIETMPVETLEDILNLQAGVVEGHFRGGRQNEVVYQIDGIPINDVYSGDAAVFVENNIIQELKVISGTFNAEYGQAQSGVVDIITKTGSESFTGKLSVAAGDYLSNHTDIFWNIDDVDPRHYTDYSLFISGPLGRRLNYLASIQRVEDEGYLYGKNVYLPVDSTVLGDGRYIPMGFHDRTSAFGKLSLALSDHDRLGLSVTYKQIHQNRDYGIYNHLFRYNPLGNSTSYEEGTIAILSWNHILSSKSFFNFRASWQRKTFDRYVYADPQDPRYAVDWRLRFRGNFSFYTGGTDMSYFTRETNTWLVKGDFISQVSRRYQLQFGGEVQLHRLQLHDIRLKKNAETGFEVRIPPPNTADNQQYDRRPQQAAVYLQSKWESRDIILNAGIRFDYFDARGEVLDDLTRPRSSTRSPSRPKYQISPRIGIAYPITDKGVMHVSYGHFFQIPEFRYLYTNPSFTVNPEEGRNAVLNQPFGNADLKAQRTVAYEIGLQQELAYKIALDVTAYYKDIRNLLGAELNTIATGEEHSGIQYGRFINRDYGQVKGFTLMFERQMMTGFGASIDYTYQVARGNTSDPRDVLIDAMSDPPMESEKQMVPLDWDRTHTLNTQVTFQLPRGFVVTVVGKFGNGMPYTPSVEKTRAVIENSDRKPSQITIDLFARKMITIGPLTFKLTARVYNALDRLNERDVYSDSGRATYTQELHQPGEVQGLNTKEEYFNRPDWFSPPRRIILGISTQF
jgi:outer membrane receptor for ferrienterochelin and colicin